MKILDVKTKITDKFKNSTFFQDKFGFENNIDITDDKQVLYRKNVVIKNIVFVTNLVYTLIFTLVSIGDSSYSNWLLTILLFPLTFFVNYLLGKLIKKGAEDSISQLLAMYVSSFYMFLSAILIYFKLKYGYVDPTGDYTVVSIANKYLSECGYILIYYSILISSFYQDKKMLKNICISVFIIVTILHFSVTYKFVQAAQGSDIFLFIADFFAGAGFRDILIRSLLLGLFMVVTYIFVAMTTTIADERKKETARRRSVENEYVKTVSQTFKAAIPEYSYTEDEHHENELLCKMVSHLAGLLSIEAEKIDEMVDYTKFYLTTKVNFDGMENADSQAQYLFVKSQSDIALKLLKRLELKRRTYEIFRYVYDGGADVNYIRSIKSLESDLTSQIIMICGIYIELRSVRDNKKAFNHKNSINYIEEKYKVYFDSLVHDRFVRFASDFESIFNEEEI